MAPSPTGERGKPYGVAVTTVDESDEPIEFTAKSANWYEVPFTKFVTVASVLIEAEIGALQTEAVAAL